MSVSKQLKKDMPKCSALTGKGQPCSHFAKNDEFCGTHTPPTAEELQAKKEKSEAVAAKKLADKMAQPDLYTEEILRGEFQTYKEYALNRKETKEKTGLGIRMPAMPEDISENITKFIIHHHVGDISSKWTKGIKGKCTKITGDLVSEIEGTQEVKCFTSDGPPTFGPKENWDVIYFLDARNLQNDRFALWRVSLKNSSNEWKGLKMNKDQTTDAQSLQGRRPRLAWESIREQLGEHVVEVFNGTLDEIFMPKEAVSSDLQ